jgi:hypothetical protein
MDKSILSCIAGLCLIATLAAEPQITLGLGQTSFDRNDIRFKGNNAFVEYIFNPFSRLQFGLKYDSTNAIVDKRTTFSCSGILGSIKIIFNTLTEKSPYVGFNAGWLNTTRADETVLMKVHGGFTGESFIGYTFKVDDYNRWNIEYKNRYVTIDTEEYKLQRYETIALSWSMILSEDNFRTEPKAAMSQEEGLSTKKDYLRQKVAYNNTQIKKYDKLIDKYNQRILDEGAGDQLKAERDFLVNQKKELETDNQKKIGRAHV